MWGHLFAIFEDFQWFVWNGHYGVVRFAAEYIPWHKTWWGPIPNDYPIMVGRALFCSLFAPRGLKGGLVAVLLLLFVTGVLVAFSFARS